MKTGRSMPKTVLLLLFFVGMVSQSQAGVPGFMKARMGTLTGRFYVAQEKPLAEGLVSFFDVAGGLPPLVGSAKRVPDALSRTDATGKFSVQLLPGSYYIGGLVRAPEMGLGPPREGEASFLALADGENLQIFAVKTKQTTETGDIVGSPSGVPTELQEFAVIKGVVTDEKGVPHKGALISVRDKLDSTRPKFAERVGDDGSYQLKLPPGRYYVMVRESLKPGRPLPGTLVGTYGKSGPYGSGASANAASVPLIGKRDTGEAIVLEVRDGEVHEGINITLYPVPDPEATRRKYEKEAGKEEAKGNMIP